MACLEFSVYIQVLAENNGRSILEHETSATERISKHTQRSFPRGTALSAARHLCLRDAVSGTTAEDQTRYVRASLSRGLMSALLDKVIYVVNIEKNI